MPKDIHPIVRHIPPRTGSDRRKPPEELRRHRVVLLLTAAERDYLRHQAEDRGTSRSRLLRNALGRNIPPPRIEIDTLRQLVRMGTNLNQIAHNLNAGLPQDPHLEDLLDEVLEVLFATINALHGQGETL